MENKFRCSSLGHLMIEPKLKSEEISETTKSYLREYFIKKKYNKIKNFESKFISKGLMVEEDALTQYSIHKKGIFNKNEIQLENDYITGTPDTFIGDDIYNAKTIIDIKSSWSIFTFFDSKEDKINKLYYWQLQGYMWLTGAQNAKLVYCLLNTPEQLIVDEKRRLSWKMGLIDEDINNEYLLAAKIIENNNNFNDIGISEKIHEIEIVRNEDDIQRLKNRIILVNEYLKNKYGI